MLDSDVLHRALTIRGLDGQWRSIEATCFPLEGLGGRHLGAVAIFWGAGRLAAS
jgi:hypothetical protein